MRIATRPSVIGPTRPSENAARVLGVAQVLDVADDRVHLLWSENVSGPNTGIARARCGSPRRPPPRWRRPELGCVVAEARRAAVAGRAVARGAVQAEQRRRPVAGRRRRSRRRGSAVRRRATRRTRRGASISFGEYAGGLLTACASGRCRACARWRAGSRRRRRPRRAGRGPSSVPPPSAPWQRRARREEELAAALDLGRIGGRRRPACRSGRRPTAADGEHDDGGHADDAARMARRRTCDPAVYRITNRVRNRTIHTTSTKCQK